MPSSYYRELLNHMFGGRLVILICMLGAATDRIRMLRALGVRRVLVLATGLGSGPMPDPEDADWLVLKDDDAQSEDIAAWARYVEALIDNPPTRVLQALTSFDPDRSALVMAPPALAPDRTEGLGGRRVYGARAPVAALLEDKTTIDQLWDDLEIPRPPSRIVSVEEQHLYSAARDLDTGMGTVWAGDTRDGVHGGAQLVRWVRTPVEAAQASALFANRCAQVRVAPFLEGVPCSIHGIVFADYTASFRPVEIVTLRSDAPHSLRFCGVSTFWDPPNETRLYMRSLAKQVGDYLREQLDFRGAFNIDGVLTDSGFQPTELNPRFSTGLVIMGEALDDLPLSMIATAVSDREELDFRPLELEDIVLCGADSTRAGAAWTIVDQHPDQIGEHPVRSTGDGFELGGDVSSGDSWIVLEPHSGRTMIRFHPHPSTPKGSLIAPLAVQAFALADRAFGTDIGPLKAAGEARTAGTNGARPPPNRPSVGEQPGAVEFPYWLVSPLRD